MFNFISWVIFGVVGLIVYVMLVAIGVALGLEAWHERKGEKAKEE